MYRQQVNLEGGKIRVLPGNYWNIGTESTQQLPEFFGLNLKVPYGPTMSIWPYCHMTISWSYG